MLAVFLPLCGLMTVLSAPMVNNIARFTIAPTPDDPAEKLYLMEIAVAVRDFSMGNDAAALPLGDDYRTSITPDAISHLLDVRVVFVLAFYSYLFLLFALAILAIIQIRRKGIHSLTRPFIIGGAIPLGAALLLGLAVLIDFNAFFIWMHGIFFADGTWTFPADSLLIRALPNSFWVGATVVWAASMVLFCILSMVAGYLLHRNNKKRLNSSELSSPPEPALLS